MTYSIKVAQKGFNALTDPVQDMLIDSNYQTMLVAFQANGSIDVPSGPAGSPYILEIGHSIGFQPFITFITTAVSTTFPSGTYYYMANTVQQGDPWQFGYSEGSSAYTADYMYYGYYLSSQGSLISSGTLSNIGDFFNVAKSGGNALTENITDLAWTSQLQGMQILSQQTYNAVGTIAANSSETFTFTHNLGYITPFLGLITNYANRTPYTGCFTFQQCQSLGGDQFGIDSNNFYYSYTNFTSASQSINFNIVVFYFIQPI